MPSVDEQQQQQRAQEPPSPARPPPPSLAPPASVLAHLPSLTTSTLRSHLAAFADSSSNLLTYITARNRATRAAARASLSPETLWALHLGFAGGIGGFITGFYLGGRTRSYQFLAENAHRRPKTVSGWYFYHKYKNYEIAHFGFLGGFRSAAKFAAIMAGFASVEAGLEKMVVGRESWVCTLGAGVTTSMVFAAASRLTKQYTKYALLFGAGSSLLVGALQDGYACVYGESVKYGRPRTDAFWVPGVGSLCRASAESTRTETPAHPTLA